MNVRVEELFRNPKEISLSDLKILKSEIEKYPYVQITRALYLYGSHIHNVANYPKILSETAAYTTDKKILYQLINGKNQEINIQENISKVDFQETMESKNDEVLNNKITVDEFGISKLPIEDIKKEPIKKIKQEDSSQLSFHRTEDYLPKVEFKIPEKPQEYQPKISQKTKRNRHEIEMQQLIAEVEAKMKIAKANSNKEATQEIKNINSAEINFAETTTFEIKNESQNTESSIHWKPMSFDNNISNDLSLDRKIIPNLENENKEELELPENSNIPQFINTWQSWLKIGGVEINRKEAELIISEPEVSKKEETEEDIITKFIENEPKLTRPSDENNFIIREKSDDIWHLMTETLANLYLEQRLYTKAIRAFEVLMDKYPDKKKYFKNKIKDIKEIRNNKV